MYAVIISFANVNVFLYYFSTAIGYIGDTIGNKAFSADGCPRKVMYKSDPATRTVIEMPYFNVVFLAAVQKKNAMPLAISLYVP